MACKGGEELRCLCLLSVLKCRSLCGVRQPRPCQLWLLDGLQGEKSCGVFVFSLRSTVAALGVERGGKGHAICCCWMACKGGEELRCLCLLSAFICGCSHWRSEAAEAMLAMLSWMACKEVQGLLSVWSVAAQARPAVSIDLDGVLEKSGGEEELRGPQA